MGQLVGRREARDGGQEWKVQQTENGRTSKVALEWWCGIMEKPGLLPGRCHLVPTLLVAEDVRSLSHCQAFCLWFPAHE